MFALCLSWQYGFAQEIDAVDELEPAVNTSALVPATDAADANTEQSDADASQSAIEPAADVIRQQRAGQVMDTIELGRTEITGNSELPTVLYIVPWRKSDPGELMGKPVNTLLDEILAPIDREEFIRQVDYYGDLYGDDEQQ